MNYGEKKPFIISGPGEYEVRDIFIKGFGTYTELPISGKEKVRLQNSSYVLLLIILRYVFSEH